MSTVSSELESERDKQTQINDSEKRDIKTQDDNEKGGESGNGSGGGNSEGGKPATAATAKPAGPPGAPGFWSWLGPAVRNKRMLKTWVRCVLASAATVVLLVDKATLTTMGQAGFFATIVSVLLPPSFALSIFMLVSVILLSGMLVGWAWGAACMAAALSVQDKTLLATRLAAAQKNLVPGIPPASQLQSLVFHGAFLDPRSSAVYGAMFFIGTFAMGALRARVPRLALMGIFGTIVMDVFCATGPLLPTANYTIAKMFLIPTTYYIAIALASLVLIFPESLNHIWLTTLDGPFFGSALALLSLQSTALGTRPSDHAAWDALATKVCCVCTFSPSSPSPGAHLICIAATRTGFGGALAALNGQIGLIDLEITKTRAADAALHDDEERQRDQRAGNFNPRLHSRFARRRQLVRAREAQHGHHLDALVPILAEASTPLRTAAEDGVKALKEWLAGCNGGRWGWLIGRRTTQEEIQARQAKLVNARDGLMARLEEWRTQERNIGKKGKGLDDPEMFAVRSLFICFVFCDTLDNFAARVHRVLGLCADLDLRRPRPRLWWPPGFGKLGRRVLTQEPAHVDQQPLAMGTANDPTRFDDVPGTESMVYGEGKDGVEEEEKCVRPRNPDARPPTSALGRFSVALGGALRFFKSPEGIFALRHAVVSLALWVPAVVPRTAWFWYSQKGLWALIMAQMGLATFAGDQLFGIATRIAGTVVGLLNGMVVWYISAPGHGNGNAYAVVVVTAVFTAPFLLARIACPPAQMTFWLMIGVTTVFVVGYSWLDTHFSPLVSNSGVGITLGWKRAVLVMVGFTAGGIVMMFPRPTSARMLVRRTLAATLREQGSIFGKEVEAFLAEEARARSGHFEKENIDWVDQAAEDEDETKVSPKERRIRKVAHRVLVVFERLQGLAPSLKMGRWEPQVQGLWPHEQYELLHAKETKLITSLSLIAGAFSKLDTKWCSILVHRTPFLNPNLLSDVFATIDILSNALEMGHPLPASLPCLRERLVYHESLIRSISRNARQVATVPVPVEHDSDSEDSDTDTHAEFVAGKVEGASIGFEELSLSVLMDEQLPTHSTAVVGLGNFLTLIDEITPIVRELCGQTTFRGFDALHHEFLGREEVAMGTFGQK
ncbi:hypothetical protein MVEN_01958900 [Mycena venus]|uniref:ER transporter 6TM N-terminal domain-containing protein n=1 Tax=Mycena venus TaxID=2733690 RepID=A0A8H6XGQ1_9AGAR|nr:hypothetical protein MVEN_01958900 [Mycena venus]